MQVGFAFVYLHANQSSLCHLFIPYSNEKTLLCLLVQERQEIQSCPVPCAPTIQVGCNLPCQLKLLMSWKPLVHVSGLFLKRKHNGMAQIKRYQFVWCY
jgi:hypothetical protein